MRERLDGKPGFAQPGATAVGDDYLTGNELPKEFLRDRKNLGQLFKRKESHNI
jgi:hypothetical protein